MIFYSLSWNHVHILCLWTKQDEDSADGDDSNDASDDSLDEPPSSGEPPPNGAPPPTKYGYTVIVYNYANGNACSLSFML